MSRLAFWFCVAWPFIVAVIAGAICGLFALGYGFMITVVFVCLLNMPGVVRGMYDQWPRRWPWWVRLITTGMLSVPLLICSMYLAAGLFVHIYWSFGGHNFVE